MPVRWPDAFDWYDEFAQAFRSDVPGLRAQVVFQGESNLPRDQFVNTWHFIHATPDAPYATLRALVVPLLTTFYKTVVPAASAALVNFMSTYTKASFTIRTYDMTLPEGDRVPTSDVVTFTQAPSVAVNLPEEVAVCLSFAAQAPVTPRKRGRLFIGPLNGGAASTPADGATRVHSALRAVLTDRAANLINTQGDARWCVYSPTDNAMRAVWSGHVDDAFDTQRRRGINPTARSVFGP